MAILNFPSSPSDGDQYKINDVIYTWDNNQEKWTANDAQDLDARFVNVTGDTMSGNLEIGDADRFSDTSGTLHSLGLVRCVRVSTSGANTAVFEGYFGASSAGTTDSRTSLITMDGQATFARAITAGASGTSSHDFSRNAASGNSHLMTWSNDTEVVVRFNCNGAALKKGGGSFTNIDSERRLKQNLTLIDPDLAWETTKNLPCYSYQYIKYPEETYYGPVVDECPADMQVDVYEDNEEGQNVLRVDDQGPLRTYDNNLRDARMFVALQEALKRIEALEAEVQSLKGGN